MTKRDSAAPALLGPERRFTQISGVELRDESADSIGFRGHAAVFAKRTWIGPPKWGFFEEVRSGAFAKTINDGDVRLLLNHDPNHVLARSTIKDGPGQLRLSEDNVGLLTEAELVPTTVARDLGMLLSRGVVSQMSFSFTPVREEWSLDDDGNDVRVLSEVKLWDVSPVTFPAYTETDAALRSAGMGLLLSVTDDLNDNQRRRVISAVRSGVITPDLAPLLRAAASALAELEQKCAPSGDTRTQDPDPLAIKSEHIQRQMRALSLVSGSWTKET